MLAQKVFRNAGLGGARGYHPQHLHFQLPRRGGVVTKGNVTKRTPGLPLVKAVCKADWEATLADCESPALSCPTSSSKG